MERKIREIFSWEAKKDREYESLARDIINAIEAKIQESGKYEFKIPFGSYLVMAGIAKCSVLTSAAGRRVMIIEEAEVASIRAERGITVISENIDTYFPFVQFTEEISEGSDLKILIHSDKNTKYDLRPKMLRFLEDIKKWEIVA